MFRIRRVYDDVLPADKDAIRQVQEIWRAHFPGARTEEVETLAERVRVPFNKAFRTILYVAEKTHSQVAGFALLLHDPQNRFCFLDFLASTKGLSGRGIGGAIYEHVREECRLLNAKGLFFECSPDDPTDAIPPDQLKQNASRLAFYERWGARPIVGTAYATPVQPTDLYAPLLVYDDLDTEEPLTKAFAQRAVRIILERRYGFLCSPDYIDRVVRSFVDDPIQRREFRYVKKLPAKHLIKETTQASIALVVTDQHAIHHIRERGYVEAPVRIKSILDEVSVNGLFKAVPPVTYSERHIKAVHSGELVDYLRRACAAAPEGKSVYPYVFPVRNAARRPKDLAVLAGYYCIDTFTPVNRHAFPAAKRAVDCALTAADQILKGHRWAYALVRPPGHHAERSFFGGFCYFNNAAIAAHYLSRYGAVAILDVDYHHGNGQQEIFYERRDVLTVSIHGHPRFAYPYFSGFEDERGAGVGAGFNLNIPLPESQDGPQYRKALAKALRVVADFQPNVLIVALGLDPAKGDPTGTWLLVAKDFDANGRMIGELGLPTLFVQEGGYRTRTLGVNARSFFEGFMTATRGLAAEKKQRTRV